MYAILFLIVLPGLVGTLLHFWLVRRPDTVFGKTAVAFHYLYCLFLLSLFLLYLSGRTESYFTVYSWAGALSKAGTVALLAAILSALSFAWIYPIFNKGRRKPPVDWKSRGVRARVLVLAAAVTVDACALGAFFVKDSHALVNMDLIQLTLEAIDAQSQVDEMLLSELDSGSYTLEEPFVALDPYGVSPLTAMVLLQTEEPVRMSVHIPGDTPLADVDFDFEGYNTRHELPIYGLYPDRVNQVELTAVTQSGAVRKQTVEIQTEALIEELQSQVIQTSLRQPEQYQSGVNFIALQGTIKAALDVNGTCRWYFNPNRAPALFALQRELLIRMEDGTFFVHFGLDVNHATSAIIAKISLCGKIQRVFYSPYGSHHDLSLTDYGTFLAAGANPDTPDVIFNSIFETDLTSGEILHFLDLGDLLKPDRDRDPAYSQTDWCHLNAVVQHGQNIIASCNFQSTVLCTSWEGEVRWMLCEREGYPSVYWDQILTPVGEGFQYCYGQHNVTVLPDADGDPDTVDLLLFDNGRKRYHYDASVREAVAAGTAEEPALFSRMVVYRVNEVEMTVEQLWSYGEDRPELYSPYRSSAQLLSNGNICGGFELDTFQVEEDNSHLFAVIEVDQAGNPVWECYVEDATQYPFYRSYRADLYGSEANARHIGVAAENLIPADILAGYGREQSSPEDASVPGASSSGPVSGQSGPAKEVLWTVELNCWETQTALHTVQQVPQYIGPPADVPYDNAPSEGMQYLLVNLTLEKQATGNHPFSWAELTLSLGGESYSRMEDDNFLGNHNYERLPGTDLKLGVNTGWICFEIPAGASLRGAALVYRGEDGTLTIPFS